MNSAMRGTAMNEEESILKQSLVFTGKLVGVFAVWVALLSFVVVTITGRAVGSLSGDKANTTEVYTHAKTRNAPAPSPAKPNG
jgi:hypothetical protein